MPGSIRIKYRATRRYCGAGAVGARPKPRDGASGGRVHRPDPGDDLPQIVVGLHDGAHRRHRPDHVLRALAAIALLLQLVGAERDQAEQRVVVLAVDPDLIGEGRAHAAAAGAAVTAIAAGGHEFLVAFFGDLGEVRIGTLQAALLRFPRRLGRAAASGGFASARRGRLGGGRVLLAAGWRVIGG